MPQNTRKVPGSGRKKGTPNGSTLDVKARLAAMGIDVMAGLGAFAIGGVSQPHDAGGVR